MSVSSTKDNVAQLYSGDGCKSYTETMVNEAKDADFAKHEVAMAARMAAKGLQRLLDIGFGTGHALAKVAAEQPAAGPFVGIDPSADMVASAASRLGDGFDLREGEVASLDGMFDAASFGGIMSSCVVHHLNSLDDFYAPAARLLVPGGFCVVTAWEGQGALEYPDEYSVKTNKYNEADFKAAVAKAGLEFIESTLGDFEWGALLTVLARKPDA